MRPVTFAVLMMAAAASAGSEEVGYKRGQVHPDFHLPKLDGTFGRLSDYRGKNVVIVNFASW